MYKYWKANSAGSSTFAQNAKGRQNDTWNFAPTAARSKYGCNNADVVEKCEICKNTIMHVKGQNGIIVFSKEVRELLPKLTAVQSKLNRLSDVKESSQSTVAELSELISPLKQKKSNLQRNERINTAIGTGTVYFRTE